MTYMEPDVSAAAVRPSPVNAAPSFDLTLILDELKDKSARA
jgi:hypothetical protein